MAHFDDQDHMFMLEHNFDSLLDKLSKFDRKLAKQTQRIILREATREAVKSLKQATLSNWKPHTGDYKKSVKVNVRNSRYDKNTVYLTYGWSNKGIADRYRDRTKLSLIFRGKHIGLVIKPKPTTYIGIWNDLGTDGYDGRRGIKGKHVFRREWSAQQPKIVDYLNEAIFKLLQQIF